MKNYAFGVDLGGTTVKIGLFDNKGTMLESWEILTRKEKQGSYIIGDICRAINGKLAQRGIDKSEVIGIGMGVPGPVSGESTVINCVNLGWGTFDVGAEMEKISGLPVKVGNDANVAALGEQKLGAGKAFQSAIMITLGTGVGAGIIMNGKIHSGAHGSAGEVGHINVNPHETESCGCGKKGCLEMYTSANGVVRLAKRFLADNPDERTMLRDKMNITSKDVFDAAKASDAAALSIVNRFGQILGKALAGVSNVMDPEAYIIGGGVSKAGQIVIDVIRSHFKEYVHSSMKDTEFVLAELGNDAGMYGGVSMLLD